MLNSCSDCISIGTREIAGSGSWRTVVGIGFAWPLILGVGILFMPESPRFVYMFICRRSCIVGSMLRRWLTAHGRFDQAKRSVALARGIPVSEADQHGFVQREVSGEVLILTPMFKIFSQIEEMRSAIEYESKVKAGWLDCFKPQRMTLYRTCLGM